MTRAIRKHLGDFLAIIAVFILAVAVGGYILSQQRLRFPFVEEKPFIVKAELENAQAVQPGQGQTVRVAGVEIGQIGKVELEDGRAVVELQIEPRYAKRKLLRENATALLRTKTGLKDMFIEVDPGTGPPMKEEQRIRLSNTAPDIDPDEILQILDKDTRAYLQLLISGAGKGLDGRGSDLRETFARLGPTHRDLTRVTRAIARRRGNLRTLIHNYGLLMTHLGRSDRDITRLVQASNSVFEALASEDQNISAFVSKLPGSLSQTRSTLTKVDALGRRLRPALNALRPPFRRLDEANRSVLPLVTEATPIVRNQIRPFTRTVTPELRDLGRTARDLARAGPDVTRTFGQLNRLFNIGAYNPGGAQGLTGNPQVDRDRKGRGEGYLYWLAWNGQNGTSLFSTSDAQGPLRRIYLSGLECGTLSGLIALQVASAVAEAENLPPPLNTTLPPLIQAQGNQLQTFVTQLGNAGVCNP